MDSALWEVPAGIAAFERHLLSLMHTELARVDLARRPIRDSELNADQRRALRRLDVGIGPIADYRALLGPPLRVHEDETGGRLHVHQLPTWPSFELGIEENRGLASIGRFRRIGDAGVVTCDGDVTSLAGWSITLSEAVEQLGVVVTDAWGTWSEAMSSRGDILVFDFDLFQGMRLIAGRTPSDT